MNITELNKSIIDNYMVDYKKIHEKLLKKQRKVTRLNACLKRANDEIFRLEMDLRHTRNILTNAIENCSYEKLSQ